MVGFGLLPKQLVKADWFSSRDGCCRMRNAHLNSRTAHCGLRIGRINGTQGV